MFFDYWSGPKANNCAVKSPNPFSDAPYDGKATATLTRRATSGLGGTEVVCYALVGGGHAMYADTPMNDPKASPYNSSCTEPQPGITENEMIGKFFDAHPKKK
jgi:poly(3-hydroxybutyrate) depolymerase